MEEDIHPARRISTFFMVMVMIMLVLSITALYQAIEAYRRGSLDLPSIMLSGGALALSMYMLIQMRSKPLKLGFEMTKVSTTIECLNCSYKMVRKFERGDYVFKRIGECPKCRGEMIISSIYREEERGK